MGFCIISIIISTIFCVTSGCHSNPIKGIQKKNIECKYVNDSELVNKYNRNKNFEKLLFLNASKPNIALLPCFENNIKYLSPSLKQYRLYLNESRYFANSPTECQSICQVTDECNHFTYNLKNRKCWMLASRPSNTSTEDGYISGSKYCETLHPDSKGGFRIEGDKPWLRFHHTGSHAWENCKEICTTNKNCTSFDYCFAQETNDFELFNCYMKGNTFSETILKTPNHCVKSIKENCSIVDN